MIQQRNGHLLAAAIFLLLCAGKFAANIDLVLQSSDTGWLIKTGQYILAHGIPATDPFSYTCPERQLVIYQWLFAIMAGALFNWGGLWLVGLVAGCTATVIYLWLLPAIMLSQRVAAAYVFGLLSLVACPVWYWARPQLISFILIPVFIEILERQREYGKSPVWLLPLLMLLWVNSHSFWFIGLGTVALYLIPALLNDLATNDSAKERAGKPIQTAIILAACIAAVFINPYGAGLIGYNWSFLGDSDYATIRELQPLWNFKFGFDISLPAYLLITWVCLLFGRRHVPLAGFILCAIASAAGLLVYRFVAVAVLITWPYLSRVLGQWHDNQQKTSNWRLLYLLPPVLAWATIAYCRNIDAEME